VDRSTISLLRANNSKHNISKIKQSPSRSGKVDQIIKANLKKIKRDVSLQKKQNARKVAEEERNYLKQRMR
jgi:hypothetical protein